MKKYILLISAVLLGLSCTPRHFCRGVIDPNFDTKHSYKIAILPFMIRSGELTPPADLRDRVRDYLQSELMKTGKFSSIDKFTIDQAVRVREFGSMGEIDPVLAREIGKELQADLVVLTILELNPVPGDLPIIANVQILPVDKDYVGYSGQARADNPISYEAGAEFAIDCAIKKLIETMR